MKEVAYTEIVPKMPEDVSDEENLQEWGRDLKKDVDEIVGELRWHVLKIHVDIDAVQTTLNEHTKRLDSIDEKLKKLFARSSS